MWNPTEDAPNPPGLLPCHYCGEHCMETEQVEDGFEGRGKLIRINAMCAEVSEFADEKDDERTEFGTVEEAVREWNERFGLEPGP